MTSNVITKSKGRADKISCASPKLDMQDAVACEISFEKCKGGFRIHCCCDDLGECAELHCLCEAICEGDCFCCCQRDGKQVCICNLSCGQCKCENTEEGCCITCTGGNAKCCEILQACCDCLECCCKSGCCCYVCFGDKCCCFGGCNS